ncbi:hypothetical protein CPB86DRAFT_874463 [Serendipita vermifera]|nr:hypothetical protein CPB86DRAFT_874463 [Serendipita vermifera]
MALLKPLPDIPSINVIPPLTVDAKAHLEEILQYSLSSRSVPEAWLHPLAHALDQLAEWLAQSDCIHDIRLSRERRDSKDAVDEISVEDNDAHTEVTASFSLDADQSNNDHRRELISRLHKLLQNSNEGLKHILITVAAPPGAVTAQELDFHVIPAGLGCSFEPSSFHLPFFLDDNGTTLGEGGSIISGLNIEKDGTFCIIGGGFRLQGVTNMGEYQRLVDILKIGVYTIMSICLELALSRDSGVTLRFPQPLVVEEPPSVSPDLSTGRYRDRFKVRTGKAKDGLWSYLTKHSENILNRVRTRSLDLSSPKPSLTGIQPDGDETRATPVPRFMAAVKAIKETEGALSTSPGVRFPPPILLQELAEKEAKTGQSDLTADQTAGLRSLLGWSVDHQFAGPKAFLRHQCITTLYSEYVPIESEDSDQENDGGNSTVSWTPCISRHWKTFRYYSKFLEEDTSLGEFVQRKCGDAALPCSVPKCKFPGQAHQLRWVTGRTRIMGRLRVDGKESDEVTMWATCHECSAGSPHRPMGHATWLTSFGKFLELLAYSVDFASLTPPLCEHTKLTTADPKDILRCRSNIIRHFHYKSHTLSFSTSPVQDVYEVRIPRVQITKIRALTSQQRGGTIRDTWQSAERDKLRLEITNWWRGVKDHMAQLEEILDDGESDLPFKKPLPPSPPPEEGSTDDMPTPKAHNKPLPSETETISAKPANSKAPSSASEYSQATNASSVALLSTLRKAFNATEQSLYASLSKTPVASINDVRRLFQSTSQAAANRLAAWEKKHADGLTTHRPYQEPDWWASGFHALPGGSIIVKEGEWASMIAYTLSSSDYINELNEMSNPRATSSIGATAGSDTPSRSTLTVASSQSEKSVLSRVESFEAPISASLNVFVSSVQALTGSKQAISLDPDDNSQASRWHDPEISSTHVSRKENPKDGSNIMSLRDVLRNKAATDVNSLTSRFTGITGANSASSSKLDGKVPPLAFGAASLELAKANAQGSVMPPTPDATDTFERILKDADSDDYALIDSINSESVASTIKAPPTTRPALSDSLNGKDDKDGDSSLAPAPMVPPKDRPVTSSAATTPTVELTLEEAYKSELASTAGSSNPAYDTSISAVGSLTSTIANAMRFVLAVGQRANEDKPLPPINHHGLLTMESPEIDSRPHIRYECVVGKRLKLSCTVYYAKQFDSLRKRCGIDEEFIQSLKKTENWTAEGGKSKSNFWKTSDDRFIIKTLVNAWNVADLQVLIELGPSYFHYMDKTAKKPSVMAKLLGFYTVELKNLETGAVQSKADLLVMENLFYQRTISQTFDLKGIEGRKVKPTGKGPQSKTLFDGEWLEGQKKALILLHPHSKTVLEEGISDDADFLASSNIMDYSLLLGVDSEQKHIACGLVDTIGSYTFAKTLEYKAKQNIQKEVTVIPPNEYRDRFVRSINSYFVACPDKWSHPGPDFKFSEELPNIL